MSIITWPGNRADNDQMDRASARRRAEKGDAMYNVPWGSPEPSPDGDPRQSGLLPRTIMIILVIVLLWCGLALVVLSQHTAI